MRKAHYLSEKQEKGNANRQIFFRFMLNKRARLTEFAGLNDSILQTISASHPSDNLVSLTNGVEPISSKMLSAMFSFNFVELNLLLVVILVDGVNACVTTRDAIEISAIENFIVVFVDVVY